MTEQELDQMLDTLPEPPVPTGARARFLTGYRPRRSWRGSWKWALAGAALTAVAFTQPEAELSSGSYPLPDGRFLVTRLVARPGAPASWRWAGRLRGSSGMTDGVLKQTLTDRLTGRVFAYEARANDAPREIELSKDDGLYVRLTVDGTPPAYQHELMLTSPHVFLDGVDLGSGGVEELGGTSLFVARIGLGSYVLALDPRGDKRFQQLGTSQGRRLEFTSAGHVWRIESAVDLPIQGPLYVFHDPAYRTTAPLSSAPAGGRRHAAEGGITRVILKV